MRNALLVASVLIATSTSATALTNPERATLYQLGSYLAFGDYCVKNGKMVKGKPQAVRASFSDQITLEQRNAVKTAYTTANTRQQIFVASEGVVLDYAKTSCKSAAEWMEGFADRVRGE